MNINLNNWFTKYLFWLYKWDLDMFDDGCYKPPPASLCKYFWYTVWGVICIPFSIIFYWRKIDFFFRAETPLIYLVFLFISVFSMPYPDLLFKKDLFTIFWDLNVYGFISTVIGGTVLAIVAFIVFKLAIYFDSNSTSIIPTYARAVKKKICPLINYENNESLSK